MVNTIKILLNRLIPVVIAICFSLIISFVMLKAPILAWVVLGLFLGLILLVLPAYLCVMATMLITVFARFAVAMGIAPSIINFFHFPMALGSVIVAVVQHKQGCQHVKRPLGVGLFALFFISYLSWAVNSGEFLRPFMEWLVFCEPFLIVFAILLAPPKSSVIDKIWKLIITIGFIQLAIGLWQAALFGFGDFVQGTLINMGAGAHVAAGITVIGFLLCISRSIGAQSSHEKYWWLTLGLLLLVFPILSDAKQVFIALLPPLLYMIATSTRVSFARLFIITIFLGLVVFAAFYFYPPLRIIADFGRVSQGLLGKFDAVRLVISKMPGYFFSWLLGLGPGNSVSRVALLSIGGLVSDKSPVAMLNFQLAPVTHEILSIWSGNWLLNSSSVWSGVSSWLGLFGDLGIAGFVTYVFMGRALWKGLKRKSGSLAQSAKGTLIMTGLLGCMFSWLEEPSYTVMVAIVIGLAIVYEEPDKNANKKVKIS